MHQRFITPTLQQVLLYNDYIKSNHESNGVGLDFEPNFDFHSKIQKYSKNNSKFHLEK